MDERQGDLDEAVQLQEALLLLVFTKFRDILCEGHAELGSAADPTADDSNPDAQQLGMPTVHLWDHSLAGRVVLHV